MIHFRQYRMREMYHKVVHSSVSRCGSRIIDENSIHHTPFIRIRSHDETLDKRRSTVRKPAELGRLAFYSFIAHHERFHRLRVRLCIHKIRSGEVRESYPKRTVGQGFHSPELDYSITNLQSLLASSNHSSQSWTSSPPRLHPVDRST
jgi:hypothetical protein